MTDGGDESAEPESPAAEVLKDATDLQEVPERQRERERRIKIDSKEVDLKLQRFVGYGALAAMVVQLIAADVVFVIYGHHKGWGNLPTAAIQAWLAATVVQVVGVVLVIARSVFPRDGRNT